MRLGRECALLAKHGGTGDFMKTSLRIGIAITCAAFVAGTARAQHPSQWPREQLIVGRSSYYSTANDTSLTYGIYDDLPTFLQLSLSAQADGKIEATLGRQVFFGNYPTIETWTPNLTMVLTEDGLEKLRFAVAKYREWTTQIAREKLDVPEKPIVTAERLNGGGKDYALILSRRGNGYVIVAPTEELRLREYSEGYSDPVLRDKFLSGSPGLLRPREIAVLDQMMARVDEMKQLLHRQIAAKQAAEEKRHSDAAKLQ